MYYNPATDEIFKTHSEIRSAATNVLYPEVIDDEMLAYNGIFPLASTPPAIGPTQIAEATAPELVEGAWVQQWVVRDATPEEIAEIEARSKLDLESLKVAKNDEINAWRAAANLATFPHAGKLIACDALSRSDIDGVANNIGLFGGFPEGFPMAWKTTDNSYIQLADVDAFKAMYGSMTAQGTANFNRAQTLKAQLQSASTPEEVEVIAW